MTEPAIEHAMDRLDVPTSMWRSAGVDDEFGEGPRLDGRMIVARLNPISLFQAHDR